MSLPRTRFLVLATALTAGIFAFVACGGDDSGDNVTTTTPSGGDGDSGTFPREIPAGAPSIDQKGLEFIPTKLTVKKDQKVYFKNSETVIHTVTIAGKNISGNMKRDDVVIWKPAAPGEYKITCDYHPQMKATITVQ